MQINFIGPDFSDHGSRSEIDDVLQRICVGERRGMWREKPDEIRILRRLKGGRGASEVLEVVLRRGVHEARKVVKLGPIYELENEFHSFNKHLRNASASFVPIEAVTPGVLDSGRARMGDREAVVYDHASRFQGGRGAATRTFEELAREAVDQGGAALDAAVEILETLFQGIRNDLYEKREIAPQETTLREPWNRRLGIDAVVAVDRIDSPRRMLETAAPLKGAALRPRDVAIASSRVDGDIARDGPVKLYNARMTWWGRRLMAEVDSHFLRMEVALDGGGDIRDLAGEVEDGSEWSIQGRLKSSRLAAHRDRLLNTLGTDFRLENNTPHGQGAWTPDPFSALREVLDGPRAHRITSLIHGDLNPRNILVINKTPCLIDYAYTNMGEPLFMDFGRLEGSLTRDVLPEDLSWAQHVRLQRFLAAACRLGDESAHGFIDLLASERAELASAFRLLWTIRRAGREIYPGERKARWVKDYLEQLFLFDHLTFKWENEEATVTEKARASAAMMGAASEAMSSADVYRWWKKDALRRDCGEFLRAIQSDPENHLEEMAAMARALGRIDLKANDRLKREFGRARSRFVKRTFRSEAHAVMNRLSKDHEVYISLKAYIDLRGQWSKGRERQRSTLEEMLEIDSLFAESE